MNTRAVALGICVALASLSAAAAQDSERMQEKARQRFSAADANHDGKLTQDEAKAGMPRVASNFAEIDRDNKGYVTPTDIAAYVDQRRGAKGNQPAR